MFWAQILHSWKIQVYGCFQKLGYPKNGWFIMENPTKMDDLGVPLFSETSIYELEYLGTKPDGFWGQFSVSDLLPILQVIQPWLSRQPEPKDFGGAVFLQKKWQVWEDFCLSGNISSLVLQHKIKRVIFLWFKHFCCGVGKFFWVTLVSVDFGTITCILFVPNCMFIWSFCG